MPMHAQTIRGNIYGGGEIAQIDGNTTVDIKSGNIGADVFGGGKGKLNDSDKKQVDASADITGKTVVNISGGTFAFPEDGIDQNVNHNVYGGGNLACKIGSVDGEGKLVDNTGTTTVNITAGLMASGFMDGNATSKWGKWETAVKAQNDNVAQGSVFGGGYGVNTVVMDSAKVIVNIPSGDAKPTNTAMVDVVGGGYNGYVLNNTSVTVEGVPEIYKIYGGGLGSHGGYEDSPTTKRSHANLTAYTMQQTIGSVGEGKEGDGTNVLIKGGKFYNDIFGGGAGLKYNGETSYLNVAEVFGKTNVVVDAIATWKDNLSAFSHSIYGGGALGMVQNDITVRLMSGEFKYVSEEEKAQVFGGSLGEYGHLDKAKVTGAVTVITTNNDTKDTDGTTPKPDALRGVLDIYGGCDMAQVENTNGTLVQLNYGQFSGRVFGGGLGRGTTFNGGTASTNIDYGKVNGNTKVLVDGKEYGDSKAQWLTLGNEEAFDANGTLTDSGKSIKIYGGGALGLVTGNIDVDVESGKLYGEVFAGSLGEMGYPEKATVTAPGYGKSTDPDYKSGNQALVYTKANSSKGKLTGYFNIYGGCDMAQVDGNTFVELGYGDFSGHVFGGGLGRPTSLDEGVDANIAYGKIKGKTKVLVNGDEEGDDAKVQLLNLGLAAAFNANRELIDVKKAIKIYGGGALGLVEGNIDVDVESGNLYGEVFAGSLGEKGYPEKAKVTSPGYGEKDKTGYIEGAQCRAYTKNNTATNGLLTGNFNVYGGCDMAKYEGITVVDINYGRFSGKIFGGGKGLPFAKTGGVTEYGMISGVTEVNYQSTGSFNGDIYGGGALGLVTPTGTSAYTTQVNLWKGEINGQIFGGGFGETTGYNNNDVATKAVLNTAKVTGNTKVETAGTENLTGNINHVYGGGDMAMVDGNTKLVITHGTFSGTIFGGGHGVISNEETGEEYMDFGKVTGNTDVLIDGPNLALGEANVYDESSAAAENEKNHATLGQAKYVQAGDLISPMNIYGGGALGIVEGEINVSVRSGTINGAVFAGSLGEEGHVNKAKVTTNATIKTEASTENKTDGVPADLKGKMDIYGACDMAQFEGNAQVTINHGDFNGRIFGGGKGLPTILAGGVDTNEDYGKVIGKSNVLYDSDGTFTGSIYGGGALGLVVHPNDYVAPTDGTDYITKVRLKKGTINDGYVFGGSLGEKTNPEKAMIHGNTLVVTEDVDNAADKLQGNINHVYGGGDMAQVTGNTEVKITHGNFTGDIYGGGNGRAADDASNDNADLGKVIGNSLVTIDGTDIKLGKVDGEKINVYGGGALGIVTNNATVNMENGIVYGKIYGGSFGEVGYAEKAIILNDTHVNINGGTITGDVFGGGALAKVDKNTYVNINGGSVSNEVYGGGALADVNQNTHVYLFGGTVKDVYGGGLGQLASAAVEESGTKGDPGYIAPVPAKPAVEAFVKGNTLVQLGKLNNPGDTSDNPDRSASVVTGSIFGCNNVNGTPKGHAKVHVLKTTSHDGQTSPYNAADVENSYDVFAVYGGGNKAAYRPWTEDEIAALGTQDRYSYVANEKSEVLIEYCNNSIAYVYGGGNAAPVPGTDVKIYGANAIDHAFAGGNGKGTGNNGADVGYLNFYSQGSRTEYGSGLASISVYGGTVHNVYGGSNTLGYIRTSSSVNVSDPDEGDKYDHGCDLVVGKTFGGGNEADIVGNIEMCLSCTAGADIVFAGANNANVYGDIHLTIQSGTFRQVFCSNNMGGAVFGKLQLDVEETGCTPVIIKELFGGGNLAAYSIYGYRLNNVTGKYEPLTSKDEFDALTDAEKAEQKFKDGKPYDDPVVNVYSCTAIGTVYGGGYGNTAKVYGNPIVNVDMVNGGFAGRTLNSTTYDKPIMVIKDGTIQTVSEINIPNDIGTIGNIFGGGKEADVYGNTTVNVCVNHPERSALISPFQGDIMTSIMSFSNDDETANDVPTGSVYGGGKMANVYGNTKVHIRNGNIEGNVFGAGQGDAGQPDAALVQGKTEVIIGE